jgi:predicted Zn-dependent peptidase
MKVETYEYKNGFRMIYEKPKNKLPLTSIYCFVKVGSVYESNDCKGIAHFIEHMCFKGTQKLSNTKDIVKIYDSIGANFNAFTTKEYTFYVVKCNEEYVEKCIHVLSDMLINSVFKKKDYELEKHVVMEEMIRQENSPEFHISKMKDKYLYSGSMFERPIDDLLFHQSQNLFDYQTTLQMYKEFYTPNNIALSVVSNLSFHTIKKMVSSSHFMSQSNKLFLYYPSYHLNTQSGPEYVIQKKQGVKATHLSISFRTCSYTHADKYILNLLSHIIGGSMTSRMFTLLREKNGLTYSSSCYYTYYSHMGEITLYTMSEYNKMIKTSNKHDVLSFIIKILNELLTNGITQEELTVAKGFLQGKMTIKMENSDSQCEYNGLEHFVYNNNNNNNFIPFDNIYHKCYADVTKKQVNDIIKKYFNSNSMVVCLFGEHVPTIDSVKTHCERFIG